MPRHRNKELLAAIGARVAEIRRVRGFTQERLAEIVGIEPVSLSRLETGDRGMSLSILGSLSEAMEVGLGDLVDVHRVKPGPSEDPGEVELLHLWRRADPKMRLLLLRVVRAALRE